MTFKPKVEENEGLKHVLSGEWCSQQRRANAKNLKSEHLFDVFLRSTKEANVSLAERSRRKIAADKSSEGSDHDFWNPALESRAPAQVRLI